MGRGCHSVHTLGIGGPTCLPCIGGRRKQSGWVHAQLGIKTEQGLRADWYGKSRTQGFQAQSGQLFTQAWSLPLPTQAAPLPGLSAYLDTVKPQALGNVCGSHSSLQPEQNQGLLGSTPAKRSPWSPAGPGVNLLVPRWLHATYPRDGPAYPPDPHSCSAHGLPLLPLHPFPPLPPLPNPQQA